MAIKMAKNGEKIHKIAIKWQQIGQKKDEKKYETNMKKRR